MTTRVVNASSGPYTTITAAANAVANGDMIRVDTDRLGSTSGSAGWTGQDLSHLSSHANVTLVNNTLSTARLAVTLAPSSGVGITANSNLIIGSNDGSFRGFSFTLASGAGQVLSVDYGRSCTAYDTSFLGTTASSVGVRVSAYSSDAFFTGVRCTLQGAGPVDNYANTGALQLTRSGGSTGKTRVTLDHCILQGGCVVECADSQSVTTITRSTLKNAFYGVLLTAMGSLTLKYNTFYGISRWAIDGIGLQACTLVAYRNVFDNAAGNYAANARAGSTVSFRGNWFSSMVVPSAYTAWTNNGYASVSGTPGTGDFHTATDPGFTNKTGRDYTPTSTSELINKGWDTGDSTDAADNPAVKGSSADAGPYEWQAVDCAVDAEASTWVDASHVDVRFVAGDAYPDQTSAEVVANWSIVCGSDPSLAISTVEWKTQTRCRLTLSKAAASEIGATFTPTDVATNYGGACTGEATLTSPAVVGNCGIALVAQNTGTSIHVGFESAGGGTATPDHTSATNPAKWSVSGSVTGAFVIDDIVHSGLNCLLEIRPYVKPGEIVSVDSSLVETDQDGFCAMPGFGQFTSVFGGLRELSLDNASTMRVQFVDGGPDTAPDETSAEKAESWALIPLDSPAITVLSVEKIADFTCLLNLSRPIVGGETITVNVGEADPIMTVGGGSVEDPIELTLDVGEGNCGIESVEQTGYKTFRVTFVAVAPWGAKPDQTSAETESKWAVTVSGVPATVASATKASNYVYDVVLADHPAGGSIVAFDTSAIETDQSGHCDVPATGQVVANAYDLSMAGVVQIDRTHALVSFVKEPGVGDVTLDETTTEAAANWTAESPMDANLEVAAVAMAGDLLATVTFNRVILGGQVVMVSAPGVLTSNGGHADA